MDRNTLQNQAQTNDYYAGQKRKRQIFDFEQKQTTPLLDLQLIDHDRSKHEQTVQASLYKKIRPHQHLYSLEQKSTSSITNKKDDIVKEGLEKGNVCQSYHNHAMKLVQTASAYHEHMDMKTESQTNIPLSSSLSGFCNLPEELLLLILSYIGPTSPTLLTIAQLTKYHSSLMLRIGDSMLAKVKTRTTDQSDKDKKQKCGKDSKVRGQNGHENFRSLMPRLHPNESNISYFVRHAACYKEVMEKARVLKSILEKDFQLLLQPGSASTEQPLSSSSSSVISSPSSSSPSITNCSTVSSVCSFLTLNQDTSIVTIKDIDKALQLSMELLDDYSYNSASSTQRKKMSSNFIRHMSPALENQILSLCGKCGGKVFKYTKTRLLLRVEGVYLDDEEVEDSNTHDRDQKEDRAVGKSSTFVHHKLTVPSFVQVRQDSQQDIINHSTTITTATSKQLPILHSTTVSFPTTSTEAVTAKADEQKIKDEERIDIARLIMRLVICRSFELSREGQMSLNQQQQRWREGDEEDNNEDGQDRNRNNSTNSIDAGDDISKTG